MKIFFIGSVSFSEKALKKVISLNAEIVGVATKSKSIFNSDHQDLAPLCVENEIPFKYVKDINAPHIVSWIRDLDPDIIFCFGWSSLIKAELLKLSPMGVVGFHPTELPLNRGRHPLIWTLVLGLQKAASTFFFMKEGADDGDILSQETFPVLYEDDASTLYQKIEAAALKQIENFLPELGTGNYKKLPQDLSKGSVWRKRGMQDGEIDFRMSTKAIYNLVRGLTRPYVGAHIFYDEEEVKIWRVVEEKFNGENVEPGKILKVEGSEILVKAYDGAIRVVDHEFPTKPKEGEYL